MTAIMFPFWDFMCEIFTQKANMGWVPSTTSCQYLYKIIYSMDFDKGNRYTRYTVSALITGHELMLGYLEVIYS